MLLTAPALSSPRIAHGFFTRTGGTSGGIYASLNCGLGSSDTPDHIMENRQRAAAALGTVPDRLCSLHQWHSADVITVEKPWLHTTLPHADAMVTRMPGIALGILTADCVPVLMADAESGIIAAAHAGWKGALAGILENTLAAMTGLGAAPKRIIAAIGPAIAQASYEVDTPFKQRFEHDNPANVAYFLPSVKAGHWYFDLKAHVRNRLAKMQLDCINLLENDTYVEEDNFFSYRRATHRGEPDYGRQISAIMLKK